MGNDVFVKSQIGDCSGEGCISEGNENRDRERINEKGIQSCCGCGSQFKWFVRKSCLPNPLAGIGKDGGLPWKLPEEMAFFKKVTITSRPLTQNAVIMGRKTYEV
jgi:hypothetical protein